MKQILIVCFINSRCMYGDKGEYVSQSDKHPSYHHVIVNGLPYTLHSAEFVYTLPKRHLSLVQ